VSENRQTPGDPAPKKPAAPKGGKSPRLPATYYNAISLAGAGLAALSLALILFLFALEKFGNRESSPYVGIIAFVILPVFLIIGLALGAIGVLRQQRRRRMGLGHTEKLPRIDFNDPTHLRGAVMVGGGFLVFLALSAFGSYQAYEYTESDQFCGTTCHTVMKPEYTAFNNSPHQRVGCVKCHIGTGAEWYVRSKLSGAYQVYSVLFHKYSRPIETPIRNLRPSRDTCEQCHWPEHFSGEKLVSFDYYGREEGNTHWSLKLAMKIGSGGEGGAKAHGIHWHTANEVTYVANDARRLDIPWVKFVGKDGTEKVYRSTESSLSDADIAAKEHRRMDCIDCHNRPTHHYNPPSRVVNRDIANGLIAQDLPGVKNLLVDLMQAEYQTEDEALKAIADGTHKFYAEQHPDVASARAADIEQAIARAQLLFKTNIFPEMRVSWRDFPDHIGHLTTPGCFRCHDGKHETAEGEVLPHDCNLCHTILAQVRKTGEEVVSLNSVEYVHPEDIGDDWKTTNCNECHGE
jgi:hypothetical protein